MYRCGLGFAAMVGLQLDIVAVDPRGLSTLRRLDFPETGFCGGGKSFSTII